MTPEVLIGSLQSDPEGAAREIRARLVEASGETRHALLDFLVGVLLDVPGIDPELESRARELVSLDRDATHLLLLARALERVGKQAEADVVREEASRTPERHITDEIRAIAAAAGIDAPWLK